MPSAFNLVSFFSPYAKTEEIHYASLRAMRRVGGMGFNESGA